MPGLPTARVTDHHVCPVADGPKPHVGGPVVPPGALTVSVGCRPVARLADMATCTGPLDVIAKGAATVLINGLPVARVMDTTLHGGTIAGPGAVDVSIGGPAFALPANFVILGGPAYQNKVIRDLFLLWTTPSGKELLRRLEASGEAITIIPYPGFDNAYATGSKVLYNPDQGGVAYDTSGSSIPSPPQVALGHELVHVLHNVEGTRKSGTDPNPPASEPNIPETEAQAIGVGSHANDYPTENSMRRDLGLDERADHHGRRLPPPPPVNLRPGDP